MDVVQWCSVCNSRPSDGTLTVVDEAGREFEIPACTPCVNDPEKVEFI